MSLIKVLKNTDPKTKTHGTTLIIGLHMDIELLTMTFCLHLKRKGREEHFLQTCSHCSSDTSLGNEAKAWMEAAVYASACHSSWMEFQRDTSTKDTVRAALWTCPEKISEKVPGTKCIVEKKSEWQKILSTSLKPGAPGCCYSTCVLSQPGRRAWACLCHPQKMLLCSAGWAPATSQPCRAACPHLISNTTEPLRWFWSLFKIWFILTSALFREEKNHKEKHTYLANKWEHFKQLTPLSSPFNPGSPLGLCIW